MMLASLAGRNRANGTLPASKEPLYWICHDSRSQSGSYRRHCEADHASAHCAADPSRPCLGRKGQDRACASGQAIRSVTFRARMGDELLSLPPGDLTSKLISRDREMVRLRNSSPFCLCEGVDFRDYKMRIRISRAARRIAERGLAAAPTPRES